MSQQSKLLFYFLVLNKMLCESCFFWTKDEIILSWYCLNKAQNNVKFFLLFYTNRSDILGQFMPLVGIDWSQTGVAHLFSDIKVCLSCLYVLVFWDYYNRKIHCSYTAMSLFISALFLGRLSQNKSAIIC